jgi:hypothetical protein
MDRIVKEAIEIQLHSKNMNRVVGFCLSKSWKPLICSLKKRPEHNIKSTWLCRSILARHILPQGYWVKARSVALASPQTTFLYLLWPALCYLLAWPSYLISTHLTLSSIVSHVDHYPSLPLFLHSWVFFTVAQSASHLPTLVARSHIFLL